jgi:transposase-like protein
MRGVHNLKLGGPVAAFKSIAGLLDDLADSDPDVKEAPAVEVMTEEDRKIAAIRDADSDVRAAKVFDMKMSGISVHAIAQGFDVHPSTVYKWLKQHAESFRAELEQQPAANIISESLQFLDKIIELCLFEANQIGSDSPEISASGAVIRGDNRNLTVKNKFLNSAIKAFGMRLELMQSTGVLPKEASHIYHRMIEEQRTDEEDVKGSERSLDDVKDNIIKLMSRGRSLT